MCGLYQKIFDNSPALQRWDNGPLPVSSPARDERKNTPGAASFNAATRQLSIPSTPSHASFIRADRQVTGSTAEAAGVSANITVPVVDFSPLTPGATYQLWVVSANSRGEGPASNKLSFTA